MIEVYVALSLLSLGYLFNQKKTIVSTPYKTIDPRDLPSQDSHHESNHTETVRKIEEYNAKKMVKEAFENQSQNEKGSKSVPQVIQRDYNLDKNLSSHLRQQNETVGPEMVYSSLLGKMVNPQEFVHNNMVPFIKSRNAQSTNPEAFQSQLERFTGVSEQYKPKHETPAFFTPQKDVSNVHGSQHAVDFIQERIPVPVAHKNVLPFKQERVGKGIGLGYTSEPKGGFHQYEIRDYALPKTVDELRVKTNPKTTFEGRIIDGQKGSERGKVGRMAKNRVDKFYKNTPDMYLKTTGAVLKEKQNPKINVKPTSRQETSRPYEGIAFDKRKQLVMKSKMQEPHKQQLEKFNQGHANISRKGKGDDFDYGKKSIMVYSNERDTTAEKTYEGNLTSLVKALIAPFEDILRFNKKEYMVDNPRSYGQMQAQIPSKQTVRDPNDVARTTVKETTLNEAERMNLRGHQKGIAYDPNDVMRTTIKETTLSEAERMNLKGPVKAFVYDPNDIARTTVKETTLNESERMNLRGNTKGVVYDPNDIARTTIKETTLSEAERMNLKGHKKGYAKDPNDVARTTVKETTLQESELANLHGDKYMSVVYDPDDTPKTTVRETLKCNETTMNLKGEIKNYVYDPNDVARTTVKETTIDNDYIGGVEGFVENKGEYRDNNYQVKETHKQYLSDNSHIGGVDGPTLNADGYKVAPKDVKLTTRQFTSDNDYFGVGEDQNTHKLMSYDDIYNANIDDGKEIILERRMPVQQGVKTAIGADAIHLDSRQTELPLEDIFDRQFENKERLSSLVQERLPLQQDGLTRQRREYGRMDDRVFSTQIKTDNPFVLSIV